MLKVFARNPALIPIFHILTVSLFSKIRNKKDIKFDTEIYLSCSCRETRNVTTVL